MNDFKTPQNELERAIAAAAEAGDDADTGARRAVLIALATNTVTVILPATDAEGKPPDDAQPLFVSDGPNMEQPMLAAFTTPERAHDFQASQGGEVYFSELSGSQVLIGTPPGAGVRLNPNQALGFRVLPELANVLRDEALRAAESARATPRSDIQ